MSSICYAINKRIIVEDSIQVNPKIVSDCIQMLKLSKEYGKYGFLSVHLKFSCHRLLVLLFQCSTTC